MQSYTTSNQDYVTQLGCRIATALWEQKKERRGSKQRGEALPGGEGTELSSPSPSSGDGYFEMGLGEVEEGSGCSGSSLGAPPEDEPQDGATEVVRITQVTWCHCVRVSEVVEQCSVCVVVFVSRMGEAAYLDHAISSNQSASPAINIYGSCKNSAVYAHSPLPPITLYLDRKSTRLNSSH